MSNADELENAITHAAKTGDNLPQILPTWMEKLGFQSKDLVISSIKIGSKNPNNKTDVLIRLESSPSLKISAKLSNADYFGNWYGHKRFINEFGSTAFSKMTAKVTNWANQWAYHPNAKIFVGVSISFGKRVGNTFIPFLDVFDSTDEVIKIVAGVGSGDNVANCLHVSDEHPKTIANLIENLLPINSQSIEEQSKNIKVICRPVNPMTEGSNRGKNIYAQFKPQQALTKLKSITTLSELMTLGKYVQVDSDSINHNHVLKLLEDYNIYIPRKQ